MFEIDTLLLWDVLLVEDPLSAPHSRSVPLTGTMSAVRWQRFQSAFPSFYDILIKGNLQNNSALSLLN